jgi:Recombinase-like helix-turn-helix domain
MNERCYLNPHQARDREPDDYQNLLGDAIERCYASGIHELQGLVGRLNEARVPSPNGQVWTPESFKKEMKRLGA